MFILVCVQEEKSGVMVKLTNKNFVNLKSKLNEPEVQRLLLLSENRLVTPAAAARVIERCKNEENNVFGVIHNKLILAVVEYFIKEGNTLYVVNLAVSEKYRRKGIGRSVITALREKHKLPIELETGDGAVGFYKKCGFNAVPFEKHGVRRWKVSNK